MDTIRANKLKNGDQPTLPNKEDSLNGQVAYAEIHSFGHIYSYLE